MRTCPKLFDKTLDSHVTGTEAHSTYNCIQEIDSSMVIFVCHTKISEKRPPYWLLLTYTVEIPICKDKRRGERARKQYEWAGSQIHMGETKKQLQHSSVEGHTAGHVCVAFMSFRALPAVALVMCTAKRNSLIHHQTRQISAFK